MTRINPVVSWGRFCATAAVSQKCHTLKSPLTVPRGCPQGSKCGPEPGLCATTTTRTTSSSATSTRSSAKPTETEEPEEPEDPEAPEEPEEPDDPCSSNENRQPGCIYECHDNQLLPAVYFLSIPGVSDQLIVSMCSGESVGLMHDEELIIARHGCSRQGRL